MLFCNSWSCVGLLLPWTRIHFRTPKPRRPLPDAHTLGEHVRRRRLELGLKQREAAIEIGTSEQAVAQWERGQREPCAPLLPGIIRFLGSDPYPRAITIAERLVAKRRELGLSRKKAAKQWGMVEATLRKWELGERITPRYHREMVAKLLGLKSLPQ